MMCAQKKSGFQGFQGSVGLLINTGKSKTCRAARISKIPVNGKDWPDLIQYFQGNLAFHLDLFTFWCETFLDGTKPLCRFRMVSGVRRSERCYSIGAASVICLRQFCPSQTNSAHDLTTWSHHENSWWIENSIQQKLLNILERFSAAQHTSFEMLRNVRSDWWQRSSVA